MMQDIRYEQRPDGKLAGWFASPADKVLLRKCSDVLVSQFGAEPCEHFDALDQSFWDFNVAALRITLHLDRAVGLAVVSNDATSPAHNLVRRFAEHLHALLLRGL
ncbi:MAG TPA: hypothetical protein VFQ61_10470 [Polyangiaceae bacterium]|nr:hypothetical protein [Polyangiaceae bacterium]